MEKRTIYVAIASMWLFCGMNGAALAQIDAYPNRTIRIIVPTPPGGMSDFISRVFAQKLTENTKHVVIVENKTGANGVIAADYVAKSPADGYTIYLGFHGTNSVLQHLDPKLPYKPATDFAPIVLITTGPTVLTVTPALPWKSVKDVVAAAKEKPGSLGYAHAGIGTTPHLVAEQFKLLAGVDIVPVPYRGQAPANQDVIAGHIPMTFDLIGNGIGNVRQGLVRALAITSSQRSPSLPDVPTMGEEGYPGLEAGAWFGFFAPAQTPRVAIDWLNKRAHEIFLDAEVKDRFVSQGMTLSLGSPEDLKAHVERDSRRWEDVIRKAKISLP